MVEKKWERVGLLVEKKPSKAWRRRLASLPYLYLSYATHYLHVNIKRIVLILCVANLPITSSSLFAFFCLRFFFIVSFPVFVIQNKIFQQTMLMTFIGIWHHFKIFIYLFILVFVRGIFIFYAIVFEFSFLALLIKILKSFCLTNTIKNLCHIWQYFGLKPRKWMNTTK